MSSMVTRAPGVSAGSRRPFCSSQQSQRPYPFAVLIRERRDHSAPAPLCSKRPAGRVPSSHARRSCSGQATIGKQRLSAVIVFVLLWQSIIVDELIVTSDRVIPLQPAIGPYRDGQR